MKSPPLRPTRNYSLLKEEQNLTSSSSLRNSKIWMMLPAVGGNASGPSWQLNLSCPVDVCLQWGPLAHQFIISRGDKQALSISRDNLTICIALPLSIRRENAICLERVTKQNCSQYPQQYPYERKTHLRDENGLCFCALWGALRACGSIIKRIIMATQF